MIKIYRNASESKHQQETRQVLADNIVTNLESANNTLKAHQIYDLYKGTKRFFCTFAFYMQNLQLDELKKLSEECTSINIKNLVDYNEHKEYEQKKSLYKGVNQNNYKTFPNEHTK